MPDWMSSDHDFSHFLEHVRYVDLSWWEQDAFMFKRAHPGERYSPDIEKQIRTYGRAKARKAA